MGHNITPPSFPCCGTTDSIVLAWTPHPDSGKEPAINTANDKTPANKTEFTRFITVSFKIEILPQI